MRINPRPNKNGEVLYADAFLSRKFDDAYLLGGRRVEEWFDGAKRRYCVARVDDCKYGGSNGRWGIVMSGWRPLIKGFLLA